MTEYRTGVRCEECGCPIPSLNILGGGLCDACWDAVLALRSEGGELVDLVDEPCGQAFPDEPGEAGPDAADYDGRTDLIDLVGEPGSCEHCPAEGGGCCVCKPEACPTCCRVGCICGQ